MLQIIIWLMGEGAVHTSLDLLQAKICGRGVQLLQSNPILIVIRIQIGLIICCMRSKISWINNNNNLTIKLSTKLKPLYNSFLVKYLAILLCIKAHWCEGLLNILLSQSDSWTINQHIFFILFQLSRSSSRTNLSLGKLSPRAGSWSKSNPKQLCRNFSRTIQ